MKPERLPNRVARVGKEGDVSRVLVGKTLRKEGLGEDGKVRRL